MSDKKWDVFISHASEDKITVARPLTDALKKTGVRVWLDEHELKIGDSLSEKIDEGLSESRFGVVILSPAFLEKHWTKKELAGLRAREEEGVKVILPIWHNVDKPMITQFSPILADALAVSTDRGLDQVASEIVRVVMPLRAKELGLIISNFFPEDRKWFEDMIIVFDRPAFRGTFLWQTDPNPFKVAIDITLKALNTGVLEDRHGVELRRIEPITSIKDEKLYFKMQEIATILKRTSNLITIRVMTKDVAKRDDIIKEIDKERDVIIITLNRIWECFGLPKLPIPTEVTDSTNVWEQFT
jgi:hypothetical protein